MHHMAKNIFMFAFGGGIYYGIELLFRGRSHMSMFILGGICFLICGGIGNILKGKASLVQQMFLGALVITFLELIFGYYLNIVLKLDVWDYSERWLNFRGQICPLFFIIWFFLSGVAFILYDYMEYWLYGGEKPIYFQKKKKFRK